MRGAWVAVALGLLPGPVLVVPAGVALGGERYTCRGEAAVLADEEYWSGTDRRDVVVASAATVDTLNTLGGDDLVCVYGQSGADYHGLVVNAGAGNDTVVTYGGSNEIYGEAGDDIVYLNGLEEYVEGGTGSDHVWGLGAGRVFAYGGTGTDLLQGGAGDDHLDGEADGDLLIGSAGDDAILGGTGADRLQGGSGTDDLDGGTEADVCEGGSADTYTACESIVSTPPVGVTL